MKTRTYKTDLHSQIDPKRLPRHIAVIMDGNGRWARRRHLPRIAGHRAGIGAVRQAVEACTRLGVPCLTLYAFSVENWKRPKTEVRLLMGLLREYLRKEIDEMNRNNIRFGVIGRVESLPKTVQRDLCETIEKTRRNTGLRLTLALNYGGRAELIDAVRSLALHLKENHTLDLEVITEQSFSRHLYTHDLPDPDLLIRTSGEMRLSNFLLWQVAYSEIWVTDILWPDFTERELFQAIIDFQRRERRYGGLG
ncbi:MAG: isoprenyl transferase [Acidobacteria bacterium]|nr:isoprenyl transferase [Acidobacteriota bacterium]